MAIKYRYERFHRALDGTLTVEALTWNSDYPEEQSLIAIEFADGTTVNQMETTIQNYANVIGSLTRNS